MALEDLVSEGQGNLASQTLIDNSLKKSNNVLMSDSEPKQESTNFTFTDRSEKSAVGRAIRSSQEMNTYVPPISLEEQKRRSDEMAKVVGAEDASRGIEVKKTVTFKDPLKHANSKITR